MRSLFLLRHGKSDWDADYRRDHDRPLAPRGTHAARQVGLFFRSHGWPEALWSSTAVRARTTLELALEAGEHLVEPELNSELYGAGVRDVLRLLVAKGDPSTSVLIAGHEPTCSGLVSATTGARCRYPTAALARIDFAIDEWSRLRESSGELRWLLTPKTLSHASA